MLQIMKVTVATLSDTVFTLDVAADMEVENFKVSQVTVFLTSLGHLFTVKESPGRTETMRTGNLVTILSAGPLRGGVGNSRLGNTAALQWAGTLVVSALFDYETNVH